MTTQSEQFRDYILSHMKLSSAARILEDLSAGDTVRTGAVLLGGYCSNLLFTERMVGLGEADASAVKNTISDIDPEDEKLFEDYNGLANLAAWAISNTAGRNENLVRFGDVRLYLHKPTKGRKSLFMITGELGVSTPQKVREHDRRGVFPDSCESTISEVLKLVRSNDISAEAQLDLLQRLEALGSEMHRFAQLTLPKDKPVEFSQL